MILDVIQQRSYLFLFVVTTVEGPISTFVGGGLAAQQILRLEYVFLICVVGDILADVLRYMVGRFALGSNYIKKISLITNDQTLLSKLLRKSPFLFLLIIKFSPILATSGLMFAGTQKVDFKKYLLYSVCITFLVKVVFIVMGYVGSISITQMRTILTGWKRITGSVIIGIIFFFLAKKLVLLVGGYMKGWVTKK